MSSNKKLKKMNACTVYMLVSVPFYSLEGRHSTYVSSRQFNILISNYSAFEYNCFLTTCCLVWLSDIYLLHTSVLFVFCHVAPYPSSFLCAHSVYSSCHSARCFGLLSHFCAHIVFLICALDNIDSDWNTTIFLSLDHIHLALMLLWCHTLGGNLGCVTAVFNVLQS